MVERRTIGPVQRMFRTLGALMAEKRMQRRRRKSERLTHSDLRALSDHTKRDIGWLDR